MRLWYETGDVTFLRELSRDRVLCLDVETTGLNPVTDEVLQVALVRGDEETLLSCCVRPERHASWPSAQRVHGISPSVVRDSPPLRSLVREIDACFEDADLIVGYNVSFDLAFFQTAGISCGSAPVFDVMREAAPVIGRWDTSRRRHTWPSLSCCARYFGLRFHAHDALEDARVTLRCFWSMLYCEGASSSRARTYLDLVAEHASRGERKGEEHGRCQA